MANTYEPLVTLDRSMRPVPVSAVSWETPDLQGLLGQVLEDRVWIPLYQDRGARLVGKEVLYGRGAGGHLRVADLRPVPAATR